MNIAGFNWGSGEKAPDEHATNLGADASAQTSSGGAVSAHLVNQARADAAKALDQSPRRRGRPPKDTSASGGDQRALQAQVNAEIARQLDALHEPKAWAALCCFPADTMLTITGRKHWET